MTIDRHQVNTAVKKIEQHPNQIRIKKILFCACENKWNNDIKEIQELNTRKLVYELSQSILGLENVNAKFIHIVKKINKKSLYFSLANQTSRILRLIYVPSKKNVTLNQVHFYLKRNHQKIKYQNLFNLNFLVDLKFTVSRQTSLSQAKILIYSALSYKFEGTIEDLNLLNYQDFDDLVRVFCHDCESIEEIKFRLEGAAHYLEGSKKNLEVAQIIIQSIRRFYHHVQEQEKDKIFLQEELKIDDRLSFNKNKVDEDTTISESFFSSGSWDFECDREENAIPKTVSSERENISPELETRIKELSKTKVDSLMLQVETILQELESYLEQNLKDSKSEEYLILKYRVLRDFMQDFQLASTQYLGILQTLEQNDRQKQFPSDSLAREL